MKQRTILCAVLGGLLGQVLVFGVIRPGLQPNAATAVAHAEEAPAEDQKPETWEDVGILTDVELVVIADHIYSRLHTTRCIFYVDGLLSWRRGDTVQVSSRDRLDIEHQHYYYNVIGN